MFVFPPTWRHDASETASSNACVAPLPEDGKKLCALSPICTTRDDGEVQLSCGSLHQSSKLMIVLGGEHLTKRWKTGDHLGSPSGVSFMALITSSASMVLLQDSVSEPVTCGMNISVSLRSSGKGICVTYVVVDNPDHNIISCKSQGIRSGSMMTVQPCKSCG